MGTSPPPDTPSDVETLSYPYTPRAGPSRLRVDMFPDSTVVRELEADIESASIDQLEVPDMPFDRPRTPAGRAARAVRAIPGSEPVLRYISIILGPRHRVEPPLPTPTLLLSATCFRKTAAAGVDGQTARLARRWRTHALWFPFLLIWATGLILLVRAAFYLPNTPETLGCTSTYWPDWPPDYCGENGTECAAGLEPGLYRCPGGCHNTPLGNPRFVGNQIINGVPLIVGGGDDAGTYRADSWICPAALHAGAISPTFGGCVTITPLDFPDGARGFMGSRGGSGLESLSFPPHYPAAFRIAPAGRLGRCMEFHWPISSYNIVLLFLFTALFTPPPHVLFIVLLSLGYIQINLASDMKVRPPDWSWIMGGLPPVLFAGYWMWNVSFRRTITGFIRAGLTLDMAIWQGAGFWIGIESSTLFAKIPISRLGYGTLSAGGVITLAVIIVVVVAVVTLQLLEYRRLGFFRYYLKRYLPLFPVLVLLAFVGHGYYLRLHHYLLSLAGIPVLSLPNRISLFGQAFLLGFFLDGVGRWGWASIIEHASELLGDSEAGTLVPLLEASAAMVAWPALNGTLKDAGITAVTVLLDDLVWNENYKENQFTIEQARVDPEVDHYLRVAYVGNGTTLDFTYPRTWYAANQSWDVGLFADEL